MFPQASALLLEGRRQRIEEVVGLRTRTLTVVLEALDDWFNVAAVLRSCEGLGIQELHVVHPHPRLGLSDAVTQGCQKWMDIFCYERFQTCKEVLKARGFRVLASAISPKPSHSLYELCFHEKTALVFGNEHSGVSAATLEAADGCFWIPMNGFSQSLNVSAAVCASLVYALGWRHHHLGQTGDLNDEEKTKLRERFSILSLKQHKKLFHSKL
ncbi:MAG: RNA methyltransferase [Proteobacteria bacterium]|nr:RNA methyltransferase [Cystobacterineae bacterium]MCL2259540.1 RNA methyltransferase [Cystobacterineae bacterium]MCL2314010.1 RNA methyltransferase [Pseudomonadota bacterium]